MGVPGEDREDLRADRGVRSAGGGMDVLASDCRQQCNARANQPGGFQSMAVMRRVRNPRVMTPLMQTTWEDQIAQGPAKGTNMRANCCRSSTLGRAGQTAPRLPVQGAPNLQSNGVTAGTHAHHRSTPNNAWCFVLLVLRAAHRLQSQPASMWDLCAWSRMSCMKK